MEKVVHVTEIALTPAGSDSALKLPAALARLAGEDPTLGYGADRSAGSFPLKGTSEAHLEGAIDRLSGELGIRVNLGPPQVAFRETITRIVEYDYTHKKGTGSTGEFARVKIRFEPQPRASGFVFADTAAVLPADCLGGVQQATQL